MFIIDADQTNYESLVRHRLSETLAKKLIEKNGSFLAIQQFTSFTFTYRWRSLVL